MSNFNPEPNVQAYGDYWLYGGLGYIPETERAKGDVFRDIAKRNLTSTPMTYELLCVNKEVTNHQKAQEILIKTGAITNGKKLSGAQRRKRRLLTLQLDAKEKKRKEKEVWICPE